MVTSKICFKKKHFQLINQTLQNGLLEGLTFFERFRSLIPKNYFKDHKI